MGNYVLKNVQLVILAELHWLHLVVEGLGAQGDHIFWGALDVYSNEVCVTLNLSNNNFSLVRLAEWELNNLWRLLVSVNEILVKVFLVVNQKLDHSNFNG